MNSFRPAVIFPPGDFIKEALEARGWTQLDLADIIGRTPRHVNELVNGKLGVTPRTAIELGAAFDTSPEFWLNLDNQHQLSKAEANDKAVSRRAKLFRFPIRTMAKRGWIQNTKNLDKLEVEVATFFGVRTIEEVQEFRHAANPSTLGG